MTELATWLLFACLSLGDGEACGRVTMICVQTSTGTGGVFCTSDREINSWRQERCSRGRESPKECSQ